MPERLHNLPVPPTRLIGRDREVRAICSLLARDDVRLVTLTGVGGTGKTRVGLAAAAALVGQFADGARFVELAPIRDATLVIPAIAEVMRIRDVGGRPLLDVLKERLGHSQLLLVLDNFEQVLHAGSAVAELLSVCPRLKVLATSRAPLRLRGEHEYPIPPLGLPSPRTSHIPEELAMVPSVSLFVERATAARPDFVLSDGNAGAVAEICQRLEGIPLALELAAARAKLLGPQALLARLEYRLVLLSGGARDLPERQRTLRDTIAWSYELLAPSEQRLFRRLAVFAGGCTLAAAEVVGRGVEGHEVTFLDDIEALVDNSLLDRWEGPDGEPRFSMLETLREFGREVLLASGEDAGLRRDHAGHFAEFAERVEPRLPRTEAGQWLDLLAADHDNLRAALAWSAEARDPSIPLSRLAGPLWMFWWMRGHLTEGRAWLEQALEREGDVAFRIKVLRGAGSLAFYQCDYPRARARWEELLTLATAGGDHPTALFVLGRLAYLASNNGEYERAEALCEACEGESRRLGDERSRAVALRARANVAFNAGDLDRAEAAWTECLRLDREHGMAFSVPHALHSLAAVAAERRNFSRATQLCEESMELFRQRDDAWGADLVLGRRVRIAQLEGDPARAVTLARERLALDHDLGNHGGIAASLETLAWVERARGRAVQAARLLGAAEAIREAVGEPVPRRRHVEHGDEIAMLRRTLGDAAFRAAVTDGRALTLDESVTEGLATDTASDPRPAGGTPYLITSPPDRRLADLTPREVEVLRLLASGYSTKQIASELVVTVPTVERHITHIYDKIGARGRAAAAAFALRHGLE